MSRRLLRLPRRLSVRIALVTTAVAVLAGVIAAGVSFDLIQGAARDAGRRELAREAELIAGLYPGHERPAQSLPMRTRVLLSKSGIRPLIITDLGQQRPSAVLRRPDVNQILNGNKVSRVETIAGKSTYVEGRPFQTGGGFALLQTEKLAPRDESEFLRRELLACLAGFVVAALAGGLLAVRLTRPLRRTAGGARALAAGNRGVRIRPEGPAEVADVATAINSLAGALEVSESRQREFLLSVSHELRTPLTAIKGFSEALADGVTPAEQVQPIGQTMLAEADRLQRLISDLLDLARLESDDFRIDLTDADLRDIVADAARVWHARCGAAGVRFGLEQAPYPLPVRTDPGRLRQIVDGLAENALRVTPSGRPIVFATASAPEVAAVSVSVRDGGPGLTDDDLSVAFDRSALYERYRGVRRVGTGLGLALVARLAARLGGAAYAGHAAEGGAAFTVTLPATDAGRPPEVTGSSP